MDRLNCDREISSLPLEVMEKIFDFLTFRERVTASLTCKTWYQAAFSPKFCRKLCLCIEVYTSTFDNIRSYQNYRNARFTTDFTDRNQSAVAEFFRAAPLESLRICGNINSLITLLDDHLLSMKQLSTLEVCVEECAAMTEKVVRINHPCLKSAKFHDQSGYANFEFDCPSLTDLSMAENANEANSRKAVQLAIKLQHQLQSLAIYICGDQQLDMLVNANLSNLKKLYLQTSNMWTGIELCFNSMTNLVELHLSCDYRHVKVGVGLGVLINLTKLTLEELIIDTKEFGEASLKMENLKDLNLQQCLFTPPTYSWQIASEHFRNLSIDRTSSVIDPVMLPLCRKLRSFKLNICSKAPDEIFVHICDSYPQLEKLYFNSASSVSHPGAGISVEFNSSTSFYFIRQLIHLKELHVVRVFLKNVDWTVFSCMNIEKLRLDCCGLYGNDVSHLFKSIGPQLRQIFLDDQLYVR